jgi:hypothetical protein
LTVDTSVLLPARHFLQKYQAPAVATAVANLVHKTSPQEHGGRAPTARQPASIPKPSIATLVETTAAKYAVGQDIPLEATRR